MSSASAEPTVRGPRVVVLGHLVRMPLGGLAWHYLQYVLGLRLLGCDVHYVEDSCWFEDDAEGWFFHPTSRTMTQDPAAGLAFTDRLLRSVGLGDRWTLLGVDGRPSAGPGCSTFDDVARTADVVVNVSAANPLRRALEAVPVRMFIDTDPAFTQVRLLTNAARRALADAHTHFFTFGENLPAGTSTIPDDGREWHATRQPVVRRLWGAPPARADAPLTTVMAWESYREPEEHDGVRYGQKADSFARYLDLPSCVSTPLEIALFGSDAPRDDLRARGWTVEDGHRVAASPDEYRSYIRRSAGEFSVAKDGYVRSRSGWFSERSANYLASGRPVVVEDTGFSDWLGVDGGVFAHRDAEEARAAVEAIRADPAGQGALALEVAAAYFDHERVLTDLLDRA